MEFIKRIFKMKQPISAIKSNSKNPDKKGSFVITGLKSGGSSWSLGNSHINKFSFADALTRCGL